MKQQILRHEICTKLDNLLGKFGGTLFRRVLKHFTWNYLIPKRMQNLICIEFLTSMNETVFLGKEVGTCW